MNEKKYVVQRIDLSERYAYEIQEIYKIIKEQERQIINESLKEVCDAEKFLEQSLRQDYVFAVRDNDIICAYLILDDMDTLGNEIINVYCHPAVAKEYWGKPSRDIMLALRDYLFKNFRIRKLSVNTPQCAYGVIKLLKDIGFNHEATIKQTLPYKDKQGNIKFYDELIYGLFNQDLITKENE